MSAKGLRVDYKSVEYAECERGGCMKSSMKISDATFADAGLPTASAREM